jgi:hypothetical protein
MKPESPSEAPQAPPKSLFWYRVKLLALVAVFLSPFIGGWLAFYVFELRPDSGNYGTLVQPVRKIDWPLLASVDGVRSDDGFGDKWRFVLFADDACGEPCRTNLYYLRQIRILLGRDTQRMQNILIVGRPLDDGLREFLREYPDLEVIEAFSEPGFATQFAIDGEAAVGDSPKIYVVDPDDNLMMHYPAESDQDRVLEDIKRLMKISQIG